jgi:hypothetical protein
LLYKWCIACEVFTIAAWPHLGKNCSNKRLVFNGMLLPSFEMTVSQADTIDRHCALKWGEGIGISPSGSGIFHA